MSPIFQAPNRGYADYQRTESYDTGVLFQDNQVHSGPNLVTPTIDVSRFAFIGGRVNVGVGTVLMIVSFYLDSAATIAIGGRQIVLDSRMGGILVPHIPIQGPFMTVQWTLAGGGNLSTNIALTASNRVHPMDNWPSNSVIIDQESVAMGAASVTNAFPLDYYAGPMVLEWDVNVAGASINVMFVNSVGTLRLVHQESGIAANVWGSRVITVPAGAWCFQVANGANPGNFWLKAIPTMTGST